MSTDWTDKKNWAYTGGGQAGEYPGELRNTAVEHAQDARFLLRGREVRVLNKPDDLGKVGPDAVLLVDRVRHLAHIRRKSLFNSTAHLDLDFLIFVSSPPERRCSEGSQG
jgi:hypothetical protein